MDLTPTEPLDPYNLNRLLNQTKSRVLLGKNSAFLGSLMSSLNFIWTQSVPTAMIDGETLWWNPDWFQAMDEEVRPTVLVHELWHKARLHYLRRNDRDPDIWNIACDIRINNDLKSMGYSFKGIYPILDDRFPRGAVEEDIYDSLMQSGYYGKKSSWEEGDGTCDLDPDPVLTPEDERKMINEVVRAVHTSKIVGEGGDIPGDVQELLTSFLAPIIPWERELMRFFSDMMEDIRSWRRPNRRYSDTYMPGRNEEDGRLDHLIYFQDVSGSISYKEIIRFNSELKYVWDVLQPRKMTIAQFDTQITKVDVLEGIANFEMIKIRGGGGTSLVPVREMIIQEKPTAAVIFSDMMVTPMEKLPFNVPILWVASNNPGASVPFGKKINIKV